MQAQCPSCGSSIPFKSQLSAYAVCAACQTLVVRKDVSVSSVGTVATLLADGSLLQVGTQGTYQGNAFEILGRIQVALGPKAQPSAIWNEWYASFANGVNGWIGEALGEYFVSFLEKASGLPREDDLNFGQSIGLGDTRYVVTAIAEGTAVSFEGELPFVMSTEYKATMVDLQSCTGKAASIDYSEDPPLLFRGQWCTFDELKFLRLRGAEEDDAGPRLAERNLKSMKCSSCGAPIELHAAGLTQTIVCQFCDAVLDLQQDETFSQALRFEQAKNKVPAAIPLGTEGNLPGLARAVRCIGYMRRSTKVDGVTYRWSEYLLYEQTLGYRWLTESQGHWTLLSPLHKLPARPNGQPVGIPTGENVSVDGTTYKHFQTTRAVVDYVAGEFYWRVRVGEGSVVNDYVAPPAIVSSDVAQLEVNWSQGTYLSGATVWKAFGLKGPVPAARGVANNQPNPHGAAVKRRIFAYLAALAVAFGFLVTRIPSQKQVFEQSWTYKTDDPEHSKLANVTIPDGTHNLRLTVATSPLQKRWAFFQMSLIDEKKHVAFDTGATVYHDAGVDDGEAWSESKLRDSAVLSQVPGGQYLLRVDPQSNVNPATTPEVANPAANPLLASPVFNYTVRVERDVPQWGYFWLLFFLGLVPPAWSLWRNLSFENTRWSESDHPPMSSWSSDD